MLAECKFDYYCVGPGELLTTFDDAMNALQYPIDLAGKNTMNPNLPEVEKKHVHALEWALLNLITNEVLEPRIRKIIGAALTCLIEPMVELGRTEETLGVATVKFPKKEGNRILTECMKAYRVLDQVSRWDINGFQEGDDTLGKAVDARRYLACCVMIDRQVGPWLEKAKEHLNSIGLGKAKGIFLSEADILSRSAILAMDNKGIASQCVEAITRKLPLAVNNDDGVPNDVGFATAGGKVLAALAPLVFASAQSVKGGCTWQLIGNEYRSVWLTVGTGVISPFPADVGSVLLEAFGECDEGVIPFSVSTRQMEEMARRKASRRSTIVDPYYIPPIDEEGEEY